MFEIENNKLIYNKDTIYQAIVKIYDIIFQDERQAVIHYRSLDYADKKGYMAVPKEFKPHINDKEDFKHINRNVLCIDKTGKEIWRIEAPELEKKADSFSHVSFNQEKHKWEGRTSAGHEFNLDISTGKLSNIRYDAAK